MQKGVRDNVCSWAEARTDRFTECDRSGDHLDRGGTADIEALDLTEGKGGGGVMATSKMTRDDFPPFTHTGDSKLDNPSQ